MKKSANSEYIEDRGMHLQRGVSLIMVMLVLVLVALTSLSASRSSFFNETVTGNEAEYNRALSAAEALIHDAQLDILGETDTGAPCSLAADFIGCRSSPTGVATLAAPFFPADSAEAATLHLALSPNACVQGICAPQVWPVNALPDNFWKSPATLAANALNAATYGQFTGAAPASTGNPILTATAPRRAWYWTELVDFSASLCTDAARAPMCVNSPELGKPFVYRITAVAQGRGNTLAVIQTFFVPYPK